MKCFAPEICGADAVRRTAHDPISSDRPKMHRNQCSSTGRVIQSNCRTMDPHNFRDDGQTKARTWPAFACTSPEAIENAGTVSDGYARAPVSHANSPVSRHRDRHL